MSAPAPTTEVAVLSQAQIIDALAKLSYREKHEVLTTLLDDLLQQHSEDQEIEVCDTSGRVLGYYVPRELRAQMTTADERDEFARRVQATDEARRAGVQLPTVSEFLSGLKTNGV